MPQGLHRGGEPAQASPGYGSTAQDTAWYTELGGSNITVA
jgi:hypothetical protein